MKIGIRNGSLGTDWLGAIGMAAELGYDGVELDINAEYAGSMMWSVEGRAGILEKALSSGCEIASLCLGAYWTISPASAEQAVRDEAAELATSAIAFAAEFGARWILLPITPGGDECDHETCVARWLEHTAHVAPVAEDLGVQLCLENVGRGCGKLAGDLLRLVQGTDNPAVGVYYDIGNAVAFGEDPAEGIAQLADVLRIVHVKDREGDLLGDGVVPIRSAMEALKQIGYDGYLVLETPPTDDAMDAGARNLEYLRTMLEDIN